MLSTPLTTLGRTLGFSFAAGINLYATVAILGLASRYGWVQLPPQYKVFDNNWIIGAAIALYVVEFFADKIPWVDSVWDAVHTVIRPIGGAFLATRALGQTTPVFEVIVALLGGAMSFASHSLKASTRLVVNTSPEPFSNIAVSAGENVLVLGAVALLWHYPVVVFSVCVVVFAITFYLLPKIWRSISVHLWMIARKLNQWSMAGSDTKLPD